LPTFAAAEGETLTLHYDDYYAAEATPTASTGESITVCGENAPAELPEEEEKQMRLWYTSSAADSMDGWKKFSLPLGNGYMGVNVFGGAQTELLSVTENTLANPTTTTAAFGTDDGQHPDWDWEGLNLFAKTYVDFPHTSVKNYTRDLVLNDATAHVQYDCGGVTYTREYFTSYPDRVLVMRFGASEAGKLDFTLRPTIPFVRDYLVTEGDGKGKTGTVTAAGDRITIAGTMEYYGINYEGQYKVIPTGGTMTAGDGTITVSGADSAVILFTLGTNYKYNDPGLFTRADKEKLDPNEYPHDKVTSWLDAAAEKGYDALRENHLTDYKGLYDRCQIDLGGEVPSVTTTALREQVTAGNRSAYYEELLFQFGRYLLIASSRKGALPPHLQGVWNFFDSSSYGCGYWHNINQQINYWPAFTTNLAELFESYVDYNEAFRAAAQANADVYLSGIGSPTMEETGKGLNGYVVATSTFPYYIKKQSTSSHSGPGTAAFTSYLFWDYYNFTRDRDFLREHTYPAIEGTANFLSKTVEQQPDGKWLIRYSSSPENADSRISMGTTYDQTMVWENYTELLQAAEILGKTDDALLTRIRSQIDHLDPINIGWSGQIKEYRDEKYYGEFGQYDHRHISQLVGLYPGYLVNENTPAWLDAAQVSLTERGPGEIAWAREHRSMGWSRLKNGEKAYEMLRGLLETFRIRENLWGSMPYFQIDGSFGLTAAMAEMLLQSHEGYLEFLPALPSVWASGSFAGMTARGGFEASAEWTNGLASRLTVKSNAGETLRVRYPNLAQATVTDETGAAVAFTAEGTDIVSFPTVEGKTYTFTGIPAHTDPAAPTALTAQPEHDTVKLQWTGSADAESYNLYAASNDAPDYVRIASNVRAEEYTARDVVGTDRITYKVTALDASGRESKGAIAVKLPVITPESVVCMDLASGARQFAVTSEPCDAYRVYCGDALVLETALPVFVLEGVDTTKTYRVSCVTDGTESPAVTAVEAAGSKMRNVFLGADAETSVPHYTPASNPASTKYSTDKMFDGDSETRWAGASDAENWRSVTVTVTLDAPQTVEYFVIEEYINKSKGTRAGDTTVEVWDGSAWQPVIEHAALTSTLVSGAENRTSNTLTPTQPVTGSKFRFTFINSSNDVTLTLFELQAYAKEPAMADKQALYEAVTACRHIDAQTLLSLPQTAAFTAALDTATTLLLRSDAAQSEVNSAASALAEATAALADVPKNVFLHADVAASVDAHSSNYPIGNLVDGSSETRWAGAGKTPEVVITVTLPEAKRIDRFFIQEYINRSTGTRAGDTTVEVWDGGAWKTVLSHVSLSSTVVSGTTNRTSNLLTLDAPVTAKKVRFTFNSTVSEATLTLYELQAGASEPPLQCGDVNGDDKINMKDVLTLRQSFAGGYGTAVELALADLNHDGKANMKDLLLLRQFLAGGYGIVLE
ncbi:MAG: glycoside hydrolase N-terminal domain-containing protein, partial [Oscillospiraceae bacterium]|nr:glycoside hydrolase N-terminal domain-containing protein [Oscillospiraceae bacterium]